ncbi:hypothetical protein TNCV_370811 [Trichonephila clavipes]|nr:hypothetical protein TNCV_370811 [Trichonephila clavipes]
MNIILKDDIPVCQRARRLSCSEKLQNHVMPVKHNVSQLNLPDDEEVPSYDEEIVLFVLPEPPISLNDIEPILHPQQQTT